MQAGGEGAHVAIKVHSDSDTVGASRTLQSCRSPLAEVCGGTPLSFRSLPFAPLPRAETLPACKMLRRATGSGLQRQ